MQFRLDNFLAQIYRLRWFLIAGILLILSALFARWIIELDRQIVARMSTDQQWQIPARVYARPLEIYLDQKLPLDDLIRELNWLGYRDMGEPQATLVAGQYQRKGSTMVLHTRGYDFSDGTEEARPVTISITDGVVSELEAEEGDQFFVRLEPMEIGTINPGQYEDRVVLTKADFPRGFAEALIAVEDRAFPRHHGISIRGIARATLVNLKRGSKAQGASTLTQQLVKNLFLTSEKTWSRKLREIFMAIVMDWRYEKDTILETFVNEVFLTQDGNRAIHGFGLASQYFFDRPLAELLPHEYALLIGMLKAPSRYNPVRNPEQAQQRRNVVLGLIHLHGDLPEDDRDIARDMPLDITGMQNDTNALASRNFTRANPAYLDAVRRQVLTDYDLQDLQVGGLRIYTNYDPIIQYHTEQSIALTFESLTHRFGDGETSEQFLQVATVVTEPNTGEVKAMVGGRQSRVAGFNRALDASRPVGSLLKPAIFLTAWMQPENYTLASQVSDEPVSLELPNGEVWEPQNYSGESYGDVMALEALSRSLNLASVNLGMTIGLEKIVISLQALGIESPLPEIPALMLGAHEFSVIEMARMYQTIAADGFVTPLRTIREVIDQSGAVLSEYPIDLTQHFDSESLYLLKYALTTTMLSGTGRSVNDVLPDNFPVAGKTGTSDDQRDSWFAGYSGDYLSVVWIGNDENEPTLLTGSSGALAVWKELFSRISHVPVDLQPPTSVTFHKIDPVSGLRVDNTCENGIELPFIDGSTPDLAPRCPGTFSIGDWFRALIR